MKTWKKLLACVLAGVLALAVFTGCEGIINPIVEVKGLNNATEEQCAVLAQQMGADLKYNEKLCDAARQITNFLANNAGSLTEEDGKLTLKIAADFVVITDLEQGRLQDALEEYDCYLGFNELGIGVEHEHDEFRRVAYFTVAKAGTVTTAMKNAAKGKTEIGADYLITANDTYVVVVCR